MMRPIGVGRKGSIYPSESTKGFLSLCQKLHEFLQGQLYRQQMKQTTAASLEKTPGGEFYTKKFLPIGLILVATPSKVDPKTTSLRIFFDPPRFMKWMEGIGPVTLAFFDPYGIEISKNDKEDRWYLILDGKKLNMDLKRDAPYEVAAVDIHEIFKGNIDAVRIR
jgi:hypothetical protein